MSKTELQSSELDRVSGGRRRPRSGIDHCPSCGAEYESSDTYPTGFHLEDKQDGCSWTIYYKCPSCGYQWQD